MESGRRARKYFGAAVRRSDDGRERCFDGGRWCRGGVNATDPWRSFGRSQGVAARRSAGDGAREKSVQRFGHARGGRRRQADSRAVADDVTRSLSA